MLLICAASLILLLIILGFGDGPKKTHGYCNIQHQDLEQMTQKLFELDAGGGPHERFVNVQRRCFEGRASLPLLTFVPPHFSEMKTFKTLNLLLDEYKRDNHGPGVEDDFLSALMETNVMHHLKDFLGHKGCINRDLLSVLKEIWFTRYNRRQCNEGGPHYNVYSSGFTHVFLGEQNGNKVAGLHNWLSFFKKEKDNLALRYECYNKHLTLNGQEGVIELKFSWNRANKWKGTIFVGTTPELEMALYTLCFLTMPNRECPVMLNNKRFYIKSWTCKYGVQDLVASTYPMI